MAHYNRNTLSVALFKCVRYRHLSLFFLSACYMLIWIHFLSFHQLYPNRLHLEKYHFVFLGGDEICLTNIKCYCVKVLSFKASVCRLSPGYRYPRGGKYKHFPQALIVRP